MRIKFDLNCNSLSFINLGAIVFGTLTSRIEVSFLCIFALITMYCPLPLLVSFWLQSVMADIKISRPARLLGSFDWTICYRHFTLISCLSLMLRCASWMHTSDPGFAFILSVCIFCEELRPLMLKLSINNVCWLLLFCCCYCGGGGLFVCVFVCLPILIS